VRDERAGDIAEGVRQRSSAYPQDRHRLVAPRLRVAVYPVVGRWLGGVQSVSTGVVVSILGRPEWLVEIDIIAAKPDVAATA
jgi:enamine deaminase RidA (YjgF/YER057c/UK114 family)